MPATLKDNILKLGNELETWDGKDFDPVAEPFFDLVKQCYRAYGEEKKDYILLVALSTMAISSSLLTRRMADMIKEEKSVFPKEPINEVGKMLIKIGKVLDDRCGTMEAVVEMLVKAHKSKILVSYKFT